MKNILYIGNNASMQKGIIVFYFLFNLCHFIWYSIFSIILIDMS